MHSVSTRTRRLAAASVLGLVVIGGGVAATQLAGAETIGATPSPSASATPSGTVTPTAIATAKDTATGTKSAAATSSAAASTSVAASTAAASGLPSISGTPTPSASGIDEHCMRTTEQVNADHPNAQVVTNGATTQWFENGVLVGQTTDGRGVDAPCVPR